MTTYFDNVVAYFFGDDSTTNTTKTLPLSGTITSFAVDCNNVQPFNSTVNLQITGSTGGNVVISGSPTGLGGSYVVTDTIPYTGDVSVRLSEALNGFSPYMQVAVTDTSGIEGEVRGWMTGQTG